MPTKRTRRSRHRIDRGRDALAPEVREIFLFGWSAPAPTDVGHEYDPFLVFELSEADFTRLWQLHRVTIQQEAKRRGLKRAWAEDEFGQ